MNRWETQFKDHQIHSTLDQLAEWVSLEFEEETDETFVERRRFIKILDAYRDQLSEIDPELLQYNQLDSLNTALRQPNGNIWNQAESFSTNGNINHLKVGNDHLTNQLTQLALFIPISKKSRIEKPLRSLEKAVDKYNKSILDKSSEFSSEIDELKTVFEEQKQNANELKQLINSQKEETNSLLSQWQEQFSASQEKRSEEFNTLREKLAEEGRSQTAELIKNTSDKLSKHFKSYVEKVTAHITDSTDKHEKILELYDLVAGDSVAASYVENAGKENKQANFWRWISISFIISTVIWLGISYYLNGNMDVNGAIHWPKLLGTISLTGVLLYGAGYSAQQSTRHRNNEKNTRRFALEVKAIDPFIASLSETDRSELKKKLSEKLFGHASDNDLSDGKTIDEHAFGTITKSIKEIIQAAHK